MVKPGITDVSQLKGRTVADPQRGGTQDIALKYYLKQHGLGFSGGGGSSVDVVAQDNAQTLTSFKQGRIDAAWLPEPWVARLQQQAGAKVLLDEKTLWPGGNFVTTNLLVSTKYLKKNRQTVAALLRAHVATATSITASPAKAATELDTDLGKLTGKKLPLPVVTAALKNVEVGWDPYATSLKELATHASAVDLLGKNTDLAGIYDLAPLKRGAENARQVRRVRRRAGSEGQLMTAVTQTATLPDAATARGGGAGRRPAQGVRHRQGPGAGARRRRPRSPPR